MKITVRAPWTDFEFRLAAITDATAVSDSDDSLSAARATVGRIRAPRIIFATDELAIFA